MSAASMFGVASRVKAQNHSRRFHLDLMRHAWPSNAALRCYAAEREGGASPEFASSFWRQQPVEVFNRAAALHGCNDKIATQVAILRAVRSFAPNLVRLK